MTRSVTVTRIKTRKSSLLYSSTSGQSSPSAPAEVLHLTYEVGLEAAGRVVPPQALEGNRKLYGGPYHGSDGQI